MFTELGLGSRNDDKAFQDELQKMKNDGKLRFRVTYRKQMEETHLEKVPLKEKIP